MILLLSLVLAVLVLFIDLQTLKKSERKEKGVYYSILGIFVFLCILQTLNIDVRIPFEWILEKAKFINEIYKFLDAKG